MSASTSAPPASDSTWSACSDDAVVPAEVRDAVDTVLGPSGLSRPEREILTTRIERWYPDLIDGLGTLYGEPAATRAAAEVLTEAAAAYVERDPELRHLRSELQQAFGPSELVIGLPEVSLVVPLRFSLFPLTPRHCNRRPDLALTQPNSRSPRPSRPSPCAARARPRSYLLAASAPGHARPCPRASPAVPRPSSVHALVHPRSRPPAPDRSLLRPARACPHPRTAAAIGARVPIPPLPSRCFC